MDFLNLNQIEVDCLEYVAGAVTRRFICKYPYLAETSEPSKDALH